jgi:hypothetical protein
LNPLANAYAFIEQVLIFGKKKAENYAPSKKELIR